MISKIAKENQRGGQGGILFPQNSAKAIDTRKEVAELAGVSTGNVSKVEYIQKNAPERYLEPY